MRRLYPSSLFLSSTTRNEIRASVRTTLRLAGITNVEECEDGDKAGAFGPAHSLAAVILDLMMPGPSGIDLLPLILEQRPRSGSARSNGVPKETPLISRDRTVILPDFRLPPPPRRTEVPFCRSDRKSLRPGYP